MVQSRVFYQDRRIWSPLTTAVIQRTLSVVPLSTVRAWEGKHGKDWHDSKATQ